MITLIHPSRSRPKQAFETAKKWLYEADSDLGLDLSYIISVDTYDPLLSEYYSLFGGFGLADCLQVNDNMSAIEAINNAAKIAAGDLLIVVSDDFSCPENWDTVLLQALEGKSDFIVKTKDGLQKTLITLPIMDRTYYNRFGYIYHPDYLHLHCDEEMTIVGHMLGKVINLDILFPHNHYTTGKFKKDAISIKNDNTWAHGQTTLDRRSKDNFGIENPLVKREDIVWK